jgi:hypothetical protein
MSGGERQQQCGLAHRPRPVQREHGLVVKAPLGDLFNPSLNQAGQRRKR